MSGSLSTGGQGIISSCVTDLHPSLITEPVQSFPVSPPPTTITFFPLTFIEKFSERLFSITEFGFSRFARTVFVTAVRKSTANIIPPCAPFFSVLTFSIPQAESGLDFFAPQQRATASNSFKISEDETSKPTLALKTNLTPSSFMRLILRSTNFLSSFIFGIPYINKPPAKSSRSKTVTLCPLRFKESATASPLGPEPITATFFSVLTAGISGFM